jgi:glycosyltransferase involved in cell wall biosynthesis
MRVLFWSDLYWPYIGGAEIFAAKLMASLRPRGIEFLVLTSHHDQELPDVDSYEGIPIRRLPFRAAIAGRDPRVLLHAIRETAAIKRDFAPDLIHMNAVGPSALFHLRTLSSTDAPLLLTLQQEILDSQTGGAGTILAQLLEQARWVVGCSQTVLEQLLASAPEVAGRASRIYNGVDLPPEEPTPLPSTPHVLALGRLVPAKGFDVALRAFATLATEFPAARFTIAGDGASREDLQTLSRDLGLETRVHFAGWVEPSQVPSLLNDSSVVVMPSRREGLPLVAVQAALMARPIVATQAGGLREIVLHEETGLTVAEDDAPAVATAVGRLLRDVEAASLMGRRARAHVRTALDWTSSVSAYDLLYRRLTETSPTNESDR